MADKFVEVYPQDLRDLEWKAIRERRAQLDSPVPSPADFPAPESDDRMGLALSGGGIRSATFCLGVLQALSQHSVLRKFDFLSTVSGGGFCGAMLGGLFQRAPKPAPGTKAGADKYVAQELGNLNSGTIRWLRENGRYLTPEGAGDDLMWAASIVRNWVALQMVLGGAVLAIFSGLWLGRGALQGLEWVALVERIGLPSAGSPAIWWSPVWPLVLGATALLVVPIGWGYWLTQPVGGAATLLGFVVAVAAAAWVLIAPMVLEPRAGWAAAAWIVGGVALLAVGWWAFGSLLVIQPDAEYRGRRRLAAWAGLVGVGVCLAGGGLIQAGLLSRL